MSERIIVGVGGHGGGEDAIALARKFLASGGEFILAHVLAHDGHGYRGARAAYEASRWQRAAELLEKVRADAGVDAHLRWCVSPSVGRGLHELCEVVAKSASATTAHPRVSMPSSSRGGSRPSPARSSRHSRRSRVRARHTMRTACRCVMRLTRPSRGQGTGISALGGVEAHAACGRATEELAVHSASLDLLVVGSRGYGPVGRLVNGSTSSQLARMARCPLLVLPRSAHRIEGAEPLASGREPAVGLRE